MREKAYRENHDNERGIMKDYTIAELAEKFGVTKHCLYKATERGRLKSRKRAGVHFVSEKNGREWLRSRRAVGRPRGVV
jgi:hypothetical protein